MMKQCDNCEQNDTGKDARMVYPVSLHATVSEGDDDREILLWEGDLCEECAPQTDVGYSTKGPVPEVLRELPG